MSTASLQSTGTRVLVVDDHPIFRAGICELLSSGAEFTVVGEAGGGQEAFELVGTLRPDVILMDSDMPFMNGLEATQKTKAYYPETKIIILSATAEIEAVRAILRAGANGYLLKTTSMAELRQAIATVLAGSTVITPSIATPMDSDSRVVANNSIVLSAREIQILELASKGETNKLIGGTLNLSVRTVEVHMHNIFAKLGVSSRTEAVTTAIRDQAIPLP